MPSEALRERIHPEDRERVTAEVAAALAGNRRYVSEHRIVTAAGETRWVQVSGALLRDAERRPLRLITVGRDVTEAKQAEARLQEALEREREARALLEQTLDGLGPSMFVALMKPDASLLAVNRPALERAGVRRKDVLGRSFLEAPWWSHSAETRERVREAVARAAAGESPRYDETAQAADRVITVDFSLHPVRGEDGSVALIVASARDITDRARAERELQQLASELEERVAARTRELEEAREEADRANRAKSEFLSRMSHELRTPLNAILGFGQLLATTGLDEEQASFAEQIVSGGRHLLALVEELLDISRIEAGALDLELEPVALREVLEEALELVRPLAAAREVELRPVPASAASAAVVADRWRLLQVALNLLSNAIKFNREGGTVAFEVGRSGPERVRVVVSDTGVGIDPDDLARLFQPFERVGAHGVSGAGLGLSLARSLVEAMGGAIGAESAPGEGSRFWFELQRAGPPPPAPRAARPRTVLLVEDNAANVRLVRHIAERIGSLELATASTGASALELARRRRPALVVLDLHLPDMPGLELLRRLRELPETAEIPVVVVSADRRPEVVDAAFAAGAAAYLSKPVDVDRLAMLLSER